MALRAIVFAACILVASSISAQQALKIDAPERADEHKLVKVFVESDAKFVSVKVRRTLFDRAEVVELKTDGNRGYCFTGPVGKYLVEIDSYDPEKGIGYESATIMIGKPVVDPGDPTDPTDPLEPDPEDPGKLARLRELSRTLSAQVGDPTTATSLAAVLSSLDVKSSSDIASAQKVVNDALYNVMLARTGDSRKKSWRPWKAGLDAEIEKAPPKTPTEYESVVRAIADGLKVTQSVPMSAISAPFEGGVIIQSNPVYYTVRGVECVNGNCRTVTRRVLSR